jgi:hypothetical protein
MITEPSPGDGPPDRGSIDMQARGEGDPQVIGVRAALSPDTWSDADGSGYLVAERPCECYL